MAQDNAKASQPEGASTATNAASGSPMYVALTSDQVEGMALSSAGALVIEKSDGSTLVIENIRTLVDQGVVITLEDGQTLDPKELLAKETAELASAEAQKQAADAANLNTIGLPAAGERVSVTLEQGEKYVFGFDPTKAETTIENGNVVLTFADGSSIELVGFEQIMQGQNPPSLQLADGKVIEGITLITPAAGTETAQEKTEEQKLAELAEELAEVEPAAGEGSAGGRGGMGFRSVVAAEPLGGIDNIGPLGPTALQFGLPEFQNEVFAQTTAAKVTPPPPPTLEVRDAFIYEDGSQALQVNASSNGATGVDTVITISGIPSSWGVNPGLGIYNPGTGTWSITLFGGGTFSGGPTLFPPADSDVDLPNLQVKASNVSQSTGASTALTDTLDVFVDAVADKPTLTTQDASGIEDAVLPANITTNVTDTDGSESITKVVISNVPAGFTLSAGTDLGGGVWQLTKAQLTGLTVTPPTGFFGSITLDVETFNAETNKSGVDFDFTNDTNSRQDDLTLTWKPVVNPPDVTVNNGVDDAQVKEDGSVNVPIVAHLGAGNSGNEVLTVTVTGIDPSWGFSAPVGTYTPGTGTWTVTLAPGQNLSTVMTFTPPADSDLDLTGLTATASAFEPATSTTATATDGFNIITDAVADAPTIDAANQTVNEGNPIPVNITAALTDLDGSELISGYQVSGVPAGFAFNQGTDAGGGVWTFTPAQIAGLTLTPTANFFGTINLTATVFNTENPVSDGEFDSSDNNNQASDGFSLTWKPTVNPPDITVNNGVDDAQVKEDGSVNVPIVAHLGAGGSGNEILTVTVTGIDASWGFSAPVGTYVPATGTWTVVLAPGQSLSTVMTFTPPADSDLDLTGLNATATAFEPATATSASANDAFQIITDAVADKPTLDAADVAANEGNPIPVTLSAALTDTDGSELISGYQISGVPTGFVFNQGTDAGGGVWTFTPAQIAGLTLTPTANFFGTVNLVATVFNTENPVSDGEFDPSDNNNQASDALNLTWKPTVNPPDVTVNGGVDDAIVKEDGSVNVPIVAHLGAGGSGNEVLTVTVTGIDASWGFSAPVGTYVAATGTWTVTLPPGQNLNTVMTFTPPANSDIDMTGLVATATAVEPATGTSASDTDAFRVITDAVADKPHLTASAGTVEEDHPVLIGTSVTLGDTDGSETITGYVISGVPAGFSFNQGTDTGSGVWTFTPAQMVNLQLLPPTGFNGQFDLTVRVNNAETNLTGIEVDFTDNTNFDVETLRICITPDDIPQITKPDVKAVDETNLAGTGTTSVGGAITVNYGADAPPPGGVTANNTFSSAVPLFSEGVPVTVTQVGNNYVGTAGANTVFTLVLNNNGTYTFNLTGTLDHPNAADHNDAIRLSFGAAATDSDGDVANTTIRIDVLDDGPVARNDVNTFQQTDGSTFGNVVTGLNGGPGAADTGSQDTPNKVTAISFEGNTVAVPATGTVSIAGDHGTLTIAADGSYTYTLNPGASSSAVDHVFHPGNTFPTLGEGVALPSGSNAYGIQPGDLTVSNAASVTVKYVSEGAGYSNSFGSYLVNPDGTIVSADVMVQNGNNIAPGTSFTFNAQGGQTVGFFIIADGFDTNNSYAGINLNTGDLAFIYKYGTAQERPAKITDAGSDIVLVHTSTGGIETVLKEPIYFTTNTGGSTALNEDGFNHVISGTVGGDSKTLRVGFEDLPCLGDKDYNDFVFDVKITESCGCADDKFVYTYTDSDGDKSTATLTVECEPPVILPPTITVNNGVDDAIVKEDHSIFVPIVANLDPAGGPGQVLTVAVTGIDSSWAITNTGGTYNAATGTWTITLPAGQNYNGGLTFKPPANSDVDMTGLNATATATANGLTAAANDGFRVITDAVADAPNLTASATGGEAGTAIPLTIATSVNDTDGSEAITKVVITGVPTSFTLSAGTDLGGGTWQLTTAQLPNLKLNTPTGFEGTVHLFVTTTVKEVTLSGVEVDLTDNTATKTVPLDVCISFDEIPTVAKPAEKTVDESNLGGSVTVSGQIVADYKGDGPGAITGTNVFTSSVPLTSEGTAVVVTQTGNVYTGKAGAETIFTLTVNTNGSYTFNLKGTLDHPDAANPNDSIQLQFGVKATDSDGDAAQTVVRINVLDDAPVAHNDVNTFTTQTVTGNVVTGVNGGPGAADTLSFDTPNKVTHVTVNGSTYAVAATGQTTINGVNGVLKIAADGSYSYTHNAGATGVGDQFNYTLKDSDLDASTAKLTLNYCPPNIDPPCINVNNGVDNAKVKEDGSVFVPIVASLDPDSVSAGHVLTVTVTGINPAWTITNANGTYNAATGTWTITMPPGQNYSGGLTFMPPANSDADLGGLNATAVARDLASGRSASASDAFGIITDAVIDTPTLTVQGSQTYSWYMYEARQVPLTVSSKVGDTDGSEVITKIVFDFNQVFTNGKTGMNTLEKLGFGLNKGVETSPGIWTVTVNAGDAAAALNGLKMTMPYLGDPFWPIHQSEVGGHQATVKITTYAQEKNLSGVEYDLSDNNTNIVKSLNFCFYLTPLVLDLNGNGIELIEQNAGVMFDMNNNGTLDKTSWVGANDGLLAIDVNGDGVINNQSELFGNTEQHANGFANLASYDSNSDGRIDASDADFQNMIVWKDANQDGVSQADELTTLAQQNIAAINLNAVASDAVAGDAFISHEATFVRADGTESKVVDAWFNVEEGSEIGVGVTLDGTEGNDLIYGTDESDTLTGGVGSDVLFGGAGADTFSFDGTLDGGDSIADFDVTEGDTLDLSQLLAEAGYDPVNDAITNFVFGTDTNAGTVVSIDLSGEGNAGAAVKVVTLDGVHDVDIATLLTITSVQAA